MVDAVASYGVNEYPPITHQCDVCGCDVEDEEILFETEPGKWVCENCFRDYIIDNLDIYEMAKLWHIRKEKAYYL